MSVLIPDLKVYNYINKGLETAAYRTTCDEFYAYCMHVNFKDKDIETESARLTRAWMDLNEKSYNGKYNETSEKPLSLFWRRTYPYKELTAIQLLKHIQCVIYNIEPEHWTLTEQEQQDYELLKKWEFQLALAIIGQTQEYKDARWSEPDVIPPAATSLTTRDQRSQIRLDKAAARHGKAVRQGKNTARYY